MPQFICPGCPAAVGIEATVFSSLGQLAFYQSLFGVNWWGNTIAGGITAMAIYALQMGSAAPGGKNNRPLPPLAVALITGAAFAGGSVMTGRGFTVAEVLIPAGIAFLWNQYISSMVPMKDQLVVEGYVESVIKEADMLLNKISQEVYAI